MLSILIPVLNEQENINPIYEKMKVISEGIKPHPVEFIFINDGSTDNSLKLLKELSCRDSSIKILSFVRNFGSHTALLAGLEHCKGDAAVNISSDSQEPPELIVEMFNKWLNGDKVVLGIRSDRKDPFLKKISSKIYCNLMRNFALSNYPDTSFDICLIDKVIIDKIIQLDEKNTSIFNLILWFGYSYSTVGYVRGKRLHGKSKWSYTKLIKLFIDSFIPFSFVPIRFVSFLGFLVSLMGFLYAAFVSYHRLFMGGLITGWSSLIIIILILSGFQLMMLGIVSEYLWRTFDAVKNRPRYILDEKIGFHE